MPSSFFSSSPGGRRGRRAASSAVVILVILAFVGLEILRRQTVRDFPNEVGHYDFHWRRRSGSGASADERVESLERLAALHESGALTDDEYEAEKALLAT